MCHLLTGLVSGLSPTVAMMEHKNMWQGPNVVVDKAGLVGRK